MSLITKILLTVLTVVVILIATVGPAALMLSSGMDEGIATLVGVILGAIWGYAGSQAGILIWTWDR